MRSPRLVTEDDDLTPHVGHQVEVQGDVKGPLRDGEIKIDRKAQWMLDAVCR